MGRRKNLAFWVLVFLLLASIPEHKAQSDDTVTAKSTGKPSKSGLLIDIESKGIRKTGYRPVDVTVSAIRRTNVDRNVQVVIKPGYQSRSHAIAVRCNVTISAGASNGTERVLVPLLSQWRHLQIQVSENGQLITDLIASTSYASRHNGDATEVFPGLIVLDDGNLSSSKFYSYRNSNWLTDYSNASSRTTFSSNSNEFQIKSHVSELPNVSIRTLAEATDDWREYSCYDIAVASLDALTRLSQETPEKWHALETFIQSGGNLIVFGVGTGRSDFSRLKELDELLTSGNSTPEWQWPNAEDLNRTKADFLRQTRQRRVNVPMPPTDIQTVVQGDATAVKPQTLSGRERELVNDPRFKLRKHFNGLVVAISEPAPFNVGDRWEWIMASIDTDRWKWCERHGLSQRRINYDVWNFQIPGVSGMAPIVFFLIVITVFVIVIGPLNYWFLKKSRRLYLLLFTVPVSAAIVTLGLITYAMFSEGIQSKSRIRSFTYVDSNDGTMTSWSRHIYYSAFRPSDGLKFPESSLVYPLDFRADKSQQNRTMEWSGGQARLQNGFMNSRTLTQFVVVNAAKTNVGLSINQQNTDLQIVNRLGVDVSTLLLVDQDGQCFMTEDFANGDSKLAKTVQTTDAKSKLDLLLDENQLKMAFRVRSPRRYYGNQIDRFEPNVRTGMSILEKGIREISLNAIAEKRVFYAISESRPATVPKGIQAAKELSGFHVIKGTW